MEIDDKQAAELLKLKTCNGHGLPLSNKLTLSAAPPPTFNRFRAKHLLSRFKTAFSDKDPASMTTKKPATQSFYTSLKGDKKRVMPSQATSSQV